MRKALILALASRASVILAATVSVLLAEPGAISSYSGGIPLIAWDAVYYRTISLHGYPSQLSPYVAFFPAYPLLCRPLGLVLGSPLALLVVSNLASILASVLVYCWARKFLEERSALICVALLLAYPPAVFLSAGYTEGLFLL